MSAISDAVFLLLNAADMFQQPNARCVIKHLEYIAFFLTNLQYDI